MAMKMVSQKFHIYTNDSEMEMHWSIEKQLQLVPIAELDYLHSHQDIFHLDNWHSWRHIQIAEENI